MIIPVSQSTLNTTVYCWGQGVKTCIWPLLFTEGHNVTCESRTDFPSLLSTTKNGEGRASPRWKVLPLRLTFLLLAVEPEDP